MNIRDRLRHCAKHTGLDAVVELLNEAATHIEGLNSTPKLQGDPSWWMRETDEGAEWTDTAPLVLSGWTPLYTTPQPAQATQAEVTDDGLVSKDRFYGDDHVQDIAHALAQECEQAELDPNDLVTVNRAKLVAIAARVLEKARAILALRPVQVPMTERELELIDGMIAVHLDHAQRCDAISNRAMAEKQKCWDMERVELLRRIRSFGITAQVKKKDA